MPDRCDQLPSGAAENCLTEGLGRLCVAEELTECILEAAGNSLKLKVGHVDILACHRAAHILICFPLSHRS